MERKEFLKSACKLGLCSCAGFAVLSQNKIMANDEDPKIAALNSRMDFIHKRFAKLVEIINSNVDDKTKGKIFEDMGRQCAKIDNEYFSKYKNNLNGFIDEMKKSWAERVEYNEDEKTIKVVGEKTDSCYCPFVKGTLTPPDFCNCSKGWQKEAYETVTGKTVESKINESILGGGERCSFSIKIT